MFQVFHALTFDVCFGIESCQHRMNKKYFHGICVSFSFLEMKNIEPVFVVRNLEYFVIFILVDGCLTTPTIIKLKFVQNA